MRTALVVVDMLEDFVEGVLANPAAKDIIEPIATLTNQARDQREWVVVYANDAHHSSDVELRVFPPHAMEGTPGAEVIPQLRPHAGDRIVPKRFYSAFSETNLAQVLEAEDVRRLVLVGQHTDCCVRHTCYDAFRQGYELAVCADATCVFGPGSDEPLALRQDRALSYLATYYGARIESSQTIG
jgi:nicotinamidase-related amidase